MHLWKKLSKIKLKKKNYTIEELLEYIKDEQLVEYLIIILSSEKTRITVNEEYGIIYSDREISLDEIQKESEEELEELSKNIYDYACNNFFEAEVLFEEDIQESIEIINLQKDCIALILTKDTNLQNLFREKIRNKLYINENPFSKEEINIPVDCLKCG